VEGVELVGRAEAADVDVAARFRRDLLGLAAQILAGVGRKPLEP